MGLYVLNFSGIKSDDLPSLRVLSAKHPLGFAPKNLKAELRMHLHLHPLNYVPWIVFFSAATAACWFAWTRGGRVERIAAVAYGVDWLAALGLMLFFFFRFGEGNPPLPFGLALDVGPAAVFLWLALRHQNGWMGLAAMAQGFQMACRAEALSVAEYDTGFAIAMSFFMQAMSLVMMGSLVGSTIAARRGLA